MFKPTHVNHYSLCDFYFNGLYAKYSKVTPTTTFCLGVLYSINHKLHSVNFLGNNRYFANPFEVSGNIVNLFWRNLYNSFLFFLQRSGHQLGNDGRTITDRYKQFSDRSFYLRTLFYNAEYLFHFNVA